MESDNSSIADYKTVCGIGQGSFASVSRAVHLPTKLDVALKVIEESKKAEIENELMIHENIHHPFIAECYGHFFFHDNNTNQCAFVMELVNGHTLLEKVNFEGGICEQAAQIIFIEILSAIKYLHSEKNVIHRDLKLENIMIDMFGNIRLIDFGLSKQASMLLCTKCGSLPYCAPEVLETNIVTPYTKAVDIYGLGVILYAMMSGSLPYFDDNSHKLINKIKFSEPLYDFPASCACFDLIQKMLMKNPVDRITLNDIENHPFVKENEYADFILNEIPEIYQKEFFSSSAENTNEKISEKIMKHKGNAAKLHNKITEYIMMCAKNSSGPKRYRSQSQSFFLVQNKPGISLITPHLNSAPKVFMQASANAKKFVKNPKIRVRSMQVRNKLPPL